MRKSVSVTYTDGLFTLTVKDKYTFIFNVEEDKGFERTQEQVLAIMECQYGILGNLIKIVKGAPE